MVGLEGRVRATLQRWRDDPIAFVTDELQARPDPWQCEALAAFPRVNRIAMKACKGPGKTTVLAWLILNFLATRPFSHIGAVSITGDNLASNLWPELAKWIHASPWLTETFAWTKTEIVHRQHPGMWWAQARSWARQADPERQADALAGLHADYAMAVLDESGGIPQAVMATAEAVLASGIETKVLQAGNPTHTTGPLHRACTIDRHLWFILQITGDPDDPHRATRVDREWAQQQITSYGRDNPWVLVNVFGEFPPASINALLGVEEVQRAMRRHIEASEYDFMQKRLGIDVARFGDDRTVLWPRQGLMNAKPIVLRHQNTMNIAARAFQAIEHWGVEQTLIDDTGHWGHGVVDALTTIGVSVVPLQYGGKAIDRRYKNRRAEMWVQGAKAIRSGASLPNLPELVAELTEPTYSFAGGVFLLEDKDMIKKRLGRSPDLADAMMNTYALPDVPGGLAGLLHQQQGRHALTEWDPYREPTDAHARPAPPAGRAQTDWDPFT